MNTAVTNTGKWLVDNRKKVLIISAVIVAVIVTLWAAKKIYKWAANKISAAKLKNAAEEHTGTSVTSTIDWSSLFSRMLDAVYPLGTNEDEVYSVLGELRTQADWEVLKRAWTQWYTGLPTITQFGFRLGGTMPTLVETLYKELTSSELQHCREILEAKGISPDF